MADMLGRYYLTCAPARSFVSLHQVDVGRYRTLAGQPVVMEASPMGIAGGPTAARGNAEPHKGLATHWLQRLCQ